MLTPAHYGDNGQRGNILFLILLAVVLFAALSYAVTSSMRGDGKNASGEKAQLDQAVMDNYTAAVNAGTLRLQMRGCSTIDYTPPSGWASESHNCQLFHPDGAGVTYIDFGTLACKKLSTDLAIGEICGSLIYAGISGGNRIYTTLANAGIYKWKTSQTDTTGADSPSDGKANTDDMTVDLATAALHPAAAACRALGAEWYLPSKNELNTLWINLVSDAAHTAADPAKQITYNFPTDSPTATYWSSSESNTNPAWRQDFPSGTQGSSNKGSQNRVRCVRQ